MISITSREAASLFFTDVDRAISPEAPDIPKLVQVANQPSVDGGGASGLGGIISPRDCLVARPVTSWPSSKTLMRSRSLSRSHPAWERCKALCSESNHSTFAEADAECVLEAAASRPIGNLQSRACSDVAFVSITA